MKILVATNLYPPYYFGGYELRCRDIVEGLVRHGHEVYVLTSNYGVKGSIIDGRIYRLLPVFIYGYTKIPADGIPTQFISAYKSMLKIRRLVKSLGIQLIYISKVQGFQEPVINGIAGMKIPIVWDISDMWLTTFGEEAWYTFWRKPSSHWYFKWPKAMVKRIISPLIPTSSPGMNYERALYTSEFLRRHYISLGFPEESARVIYCGCPEMFISDDQKDRPQKPFRFLYAGQLVETKGVHTILEATTLLRTKNSSCSFTVDIVGSGISEYVEKLKNYSTSNGLDSIVRFMGKTNRSEMPQVYRRYDTFILPSIWDEPFALTPLEAMASGVPVIGTTTGGSRELIKDGETALEFKAGNAPDLADQMNRMMADNSLWLNLREKGRSLIASRFTLEHMVDSVEKYLEETLAAAKKQYERTSNITEYSVQAEVRG